MKRSSSATGPRRLASALVLGGPLVAGCGSTSPPAGAPAESVGAPAPQTERQKKAAAFDRNLKSKTSHD